MSKTRFSGLLSVLLIAFILTSCDVFNKTAEQYLSASQDYFSKGEYTASLIEIKNAIQQDPANSDVRQFAAQIYLKLGNPDDAETQLTKAVRLGVDEFQVMPLHAHVLFQQRKYKQLLALVVPDSLSQSDQASIYVYQGFSAAELKDMAAANTLYRKSIELKVDNLLAYRGIALLHASKGEFDQALQVIRKLIDKQPGNSELWSLQGDIYVSSQQFDNAYASYTSAVELTEGKSYQYIAKRALVCISKDDIECVNKDVAELVNNVPGYYMTAYVKGLLAIKQQRWKDAYSVLMGALTINAELTPAYYFAGMALFQDKQYGSAVTQLSSFVARQPESVNGRHLLSLAQLREGHLESAKTTLQPIIVSGKSGSSIVYLMGQIEYALGNIANSIRYFKQLSQLQPESALVHTQLGLKLMASGDKLGGLDALAVAIDIAPDVLEAGQASVLAYLDSNQFDKAQALINKLQSSNANSAILFNLQGVLHMQKEQLHEAKKSFGRALKLEPGDPTAAHNLARLMFKQGDVQNTRQLYHDVLKHHPKHIPTHLKLAELDLKQGNDIKAEQRLLALITQQPSALAPRLVLAQYYLISGRVDSVSGILEPMTQLYPKDERLLTVLAESLLASEHPGKAKHEAQFLVNSLPDSANAHWLLARSAIADLDMIKGKEALKKTLSLNPDHVPAQIVRIKLLTEDKDLDRAARALQKLITQASGDPRVGSLSAWMALVSGDNIKAVKRYKKVFSVSATSANAMGLAQAQWQAGQREDSVATLQQWVFKYPDDVKVHFRLGMRYMQMGLDGEASARFNRVLQFDPNNVVVLNNLAWLLRNENSVKALRYIERAAELEPDSAAVFDTLGVVLLQHGSLARALRVFERATRAHPEHAAIQYHYAIALHRNNQTKQAMQILAQLIQSFPEFDNKAQAQMLLRKLKTSTGVSS